jgi:hypothetical protein
MLGKCEGKDMWNYTTFKIGLIGIIWKKNEIICELFGITFGVTLINLTVIPNGITFGITWNYLENNSIFGITRLFFWCLAPRENE